ncbi:MAG: hypothetical protein R3331_09345 [Sulfurospirillaceae bacterium]|nr:hypothetical protein [Sulfurospirillaceae bacterium]
MTESDERDLLAACEVIKDLNTEAFLANIKALFEEFLGRLS